MGQYYVPVIIGYDEDGKAIILKYIVPSGNKFWEHNEINSPVVLAIEALLCPGGPHHKSRLVWAGDYAEPEDGYDRTEGEDGDDDGVTLYSLATAEYYKDKSAPVRPVTASPTDYRYIVNHTKLQFVDKFKPVVMSWCQKTSKRGKNGKKIGKPAYPRMRPSVHPLPVLTAEGENDYWFANNPHLFGHWARDVISMENSVPAAEDGFTELVCDFSGQDDDSEILDDDEEVEGAGATSGASGSVSSRK